MPAIAVLLVKPPMLDTEIPCHSDLGVGRECFYLVKTLLSRNPDHGKTMAQKRAEAPRKQKEQKKNLCQGKRNCMLHLFQSHSLFFLVGFVKLV